MYDKRAESRAAAFGILDRMQALENALLKIEGISDIDFDIDNYDELHHVLSGKAPGRTSDEERIISYNYGMGLHDIVFASRIYELSGDETSFCWNVQDQKVWV